MSQFMLLIRNQGPAMAGLSQEEIAAHMTQWGTYMGGLQAAGQLEGGFPFSGDSSAVMSKGGTTVTKGFYTEANDVSLGGYLLVNAKNLDHAIELAKGCPAFDNDSATIEVRECMMMPEPA